MGSIRGTPKTRLTSIRRNQTSPSRGFVVKYGGTRTKKEGPSKEENKNTITKRSSYWRGKKSKGGSAAAVTVECQGETTTRLWSPKRRKTGNSDLENLLGGGLMVCGGRNGLGEAAGACSEDDDGAKWVGVAGLEDLSN